MVRFVIFFCTILCSPISLVATVSVTLYVDDLEDVTSNQNYCKLDNSTTNGCNLRSAILKCYNLFHGANSDTFCNIILPEYSKLVRLSAQGLPYLFPIPPLQYSMSINGMGSTISPAVGRSGYFFMTLRGQVTFIFSNFTVSGFRTTGNGGGMRFYGVQNATLDNISFVNNNGTNGGAVYVYNSSYMSFINCNFFKNSAITYGGAMYVSTTDHWYMAHSLVRYNTGKLGGGGVFIDEHCPFAQVSSTVFESNLANKGSGGSVHVNTHNDRFLMENCTVTSSVAGIAGGGLYLGSHNDNATITSSVISFNNGKQGGGAMTVNDYNHHFTLVLSSVISNNASSGNGNGIAILNNNHYGSVVNCSISANQGTGSGGGMYLDTGNDFFSIRDTVLEDNWATDGAAILIYKNNLNVLLVDCHINHNVATGLGGGLAVLNNNDYLNVQSTRIVSNKAKNGGGIYMNQFNNFVSVGCCNIFGNEALFTSEGGDGGGIYASKANTFFLIRNTTFDRNLALNMGGALYLNVDNTDTAIWNSTFVDNTALIYGGGIYLDTSSNRFHMEDCVVDYNNAYVGGGVYVNQGNNDLVIAKSLFTRNAADLDGGGLFFSQRNSRVHISDCVVSDNIALNNGGALMVGQLNTMLSIFYSSFVTNNAGSGGGIYVQFNNDNMTLVANNVSMNTAGLHVLGNGDGAGIYIYGGNDHLLLRNNLISDNYASSKGGGLLVAVQNRHLTITNGMFLGNYAETGGGLYVFQYNHHLTVTSCGIYGNFGMASGGGLYLYKNNYVARITSCNIHNNLALYDGGGMFVHSVTDLLVQSCVFESNNAYQGNGGGVVLTSTTYCLFVDCTFTGGYAMYGAGISVQALNAYIDIIDCSFSYNSGSKGGGLLIGGSSNFINVVHCEFTSNFVSTDNGGGICAADVYSLSITDCSFTGNSALISSGGGISFSTSVRYSNISRCIFDDNYARNGGGMSMTGGGESPRLQDLLFVHNSAYYGGGALFLSSSIYSARFDNISFIRNTALFSSGGAVHLGESVVDFLFTGCIFEYNGILKGYNGQSGIDSNGGALYLGFGNSGTVQESVFVFNWAMGGGAAIMLANGQTNCSIIQCIFRNNSLSVDGVGGVVAVTGSENVNLIIQYCLFGNNSAGALSLSNVKFLYVSNNNFTGNVAMSTGGGMSVWGTENKNITVMDCIFEGNSAADKGGAVFVSNLENVYIGHNLFLNNRVSERGSGSAVYAAKAINIVVDRNIFQHNIAGMGGTVFWESRTMEEPHSLTSHNTWVGNKAGYGSLYATDIYVVRSPSNVSAYRYPEKDLLPVIAIQAFDFYQQAMTVLHGGRVQAILNVVTSRCQPFSASVVGALEAPFVSGIAVFQRVFAQCVPGGTFSLSFTTPVLTNGTATRVDFPPCLAGDTTSSSKCTCPVEAIRCHYNDLQIKSGLWRVSENAFTAQQCPYGPACLGGNGSGDAVCHVGHTGPLCSICAKEFFLADTVGKCEKCNAGNSDFWTVIYVIVAIMIYLAFTALVIWYVIRVSYHRKKRQQDADKGLHHSHKMQQDNVNVNNIKVVNEKLNETLSQTLNPHRLRMTREVVYILRDNFKIIFSAFQIVAVLEATLTSKFPSSFQKLSTSFSWIDTSTLMNLIRLNCSSKSDHVSELMLLTLGPIAITMGWIVTYKLIAFYFRWTNRSEVVLKNIRTHFTYVFLLGSFFLLPGVSQHITRTFPCQNIDPDGATGQSQFVLIADHSISCSSTRYQQGVRWALGMLVVYPIGVPVLYLVVLTLYRTRILADGRKDLNNDVPGTNEIRYKSLAQVAFLFVDYELQYWYWEVIETIRKLLLTAILSIISSHIGIQIVFGIVVCIAFVKIYGYYKPYESERTDTLQELAQYQVLLTFIGCLLLEFDVLASVEDSSVAIAALIIYCRVKEVQEEKKANKEDKNGVKDKDDGDGVGEEQGQEHEQDILIRDKIHGLFTDIQNREELWSRVDAELAKTGLQKTFQMDDVDRPEKHSSERHLHQSRRQQSGDGNLDAMRGDKCKDGDGDGDYQKKKRKDDYDAVQQGPASLSSPKNSTRRGLGKSKTDVGSQERRPPALRSLSSRTTRRISSPPVLDQRSSSVFSRYAFDCAAATAGLSKDPENENGEVEEEDCAFDVTHPTLALSFTRGSISKFRKKAENSNTILQRKIFLILLEKLFFRDTFYQKLPLLTSFEEIADERVLAIHSSFIKSMTMSVSVFYSSLVFLSLSLCPR
eukprot:gene1204-2339_t